MAEPNSIEPWVLFAVGFVGVVGTLLGAVVADVLARRRERRAAMARQRRAVSAVAGELLDALSILSRAFERGRWWPPADAPRDRAWVEYQDDLAELLNDDAWHHMRMTYEALRSLDAMREDPDRRARPWESVAGRQVWSARWVEAPAAAEDAAQAIAHTLNLLGKHHAVMARPEDQVAMERLRNSPPDVPDEADPGLETSAYRRV